MRLPRVKVWWLLALVAGVAVVLGVPRLWNAHREMSWRSWAYFRTANQLDELADEWRQAVAAERQAARADRGDAAFRLTLAREYERAIPGTIARARNYYRAATFPWLGDPHSTIPAARSYEGDDETP